MTYLFYNWKFVPLDALSPLLHGLPRWFSGKESPTNARDSRDAGLILGSGRSPGVRNGNLLQYSCLENSMDKKLAWKIPWIKDKGAWWNKVHRVTSSCTHTGTLIPHHSRHPHQFFPVSMSSPLRLFF